MYAQCFSKSAHVEPFFGCLPVALVQELHKSAAIQHFLIIAAIFTSGMQVVHHFAAVEAMYSTTHRPYVKIDKWLLASRLMPFMRWIARNG